MNERFEVWAGQSAASVFRSARNSMHNRRRWFAESGTETEDATKQAGGEQSAGGSSAETENTGDRSAIIPRERFDEVNAAKKAAEAEREKYRAELDALKAEREKEAAKRETEERKRKEQQGEFQKLYEEAQTKVTDLEAQLVSANEQLTRYRETVQAMLDKRMEAAPDHIKALLAEMDDQLKVMAWLDANAEKLNPQQDQAAKPNPPRMNAGDGTQNLKGIKEVNVPRKLTRF